jgi:hypothetical protein
MRAVQITRFGGPEVLEILDVPEPTAHVAGHRRPRLQRVEQSLQELSGAGLAWLDEHL